MKYLLLAYLIWDPQNTETIVHEVPSEPACVAYAERIGEFRGLRVTRLPYGAADGFLTFNQSSLRYKCLPLDGSGVPGR
ncbi:hypothetical protein G6L37_05685 [Agrobacterium rubi]|nr:hypothetical protein [Agrobacterium rubi]NTF24850.1 hypothetical protein [Agrobacterium rubi]